MASLTLTIDAVCAGGDHLTLGLVLDGQAKRVARCVRSELTAPLTEEEIEAAMKVLIRLHARGKTANQVRNNLQAGLVVTI